MADRDIEIGACDRRDGFHNVSVAVVGFGDDGLSLTLGAGRYFVHLPENILEDDNFYRLEIDYRQYKTVGKRKVIAWTAQSKNVFGDVPLTQYILTGTPFDLRGYYMGQYRDKSSHVVMAEYRQMINTDKSTWLKRMLNHVGFVAWTGCGFMGPTPGKIEGVLPNYGVGLRIEVQPRMNVRLDLGKNTVNNQTLFYFNMTEAF